ncbi:MAG: 30S ribosomal protein S4 [Patescibacteria group bacterium]|jgi:small subunit ribosomal protein S4
MARNLKPRCKQCRRIGESVCGKAKCALRKRNTVPGQHGNSKRRPRITQYGLQLREKQKAKLLYGILEKQFQNYFTAASKHVGNTSELFMQLLEMRLDNAVYRSGFSTTRRQARQLVSHAHVLVNGKICNIPSRQLKINDVVSIKTNSQASKLIKDMVPTLKMHEAPQWLQVSADPLQFKVMAKPTTKDAEQGILVNLIVEYYSR